MRDRSWKTLGPYLPDPFAYISAAAFDGAQLYIATQGRGLLYASDPFVARVATYFDPTPSNQLSLAALRDNIAAPIPSASVSVLVTRVDSNVAGRLPVETRTAVVNRNVITGAGGTVSILDTLASGRYIVKLAFSGDGQLAPCETRFLVSR